MVKIEMHYVNSVKISEIQEIKTKSDKTFYQTKIIIQGSDDLLTLIVNCMDRETLNFVDLLYNQGKQKKPVKKK